MYWHELFASMQAIVMLKIVFCKSLHRQLSSLHVQAMRTVIVAHPIFLIYGFQ